MLASSAGVAGQFHEFGIIGLAEGKGMKKEKEKKKENAKMKEKQVQIRKKREGNHRKKQACRLNKAKGAVRVRALYAFV